VGVRGLLIRWSLAGLATAANLRGGWRPRRRLPGQRAERPGARQPLRRRGGERRRGQHDLLQPADLTPLKGTQFVAGGSPSSRRPTSATTARPCAPLSSSPSGLAVSRRAASGGRW